MGCKNTLIGLNEQTTNEAAHKDTTPERKLIGASVFLCICESAIKLSNHYIAMFNCTAIQGCEPKKPYLFRALAHSHLG
jgi:hypothetical protein